jgi:opacity protein-like surface antigen
VFIAGLGRKELQMNARIRYCIFIAIGSLAASASQAAAPDTPWGVTLFGGGAVAEDGSLRNLHEGTLGGQALRMDRLDFDELYRDRFEAGAEVSYDLQPNVEAFGRFSYETGDGRVRRIGALAAQPIEARFADDDAWTLDLGSRFYFRTGEPLRPFAGVSLGATRVAGIKATLSSPDEGQQVRFSRDGTVFSQSLEAGLQYAAMRNLDLRLSLDATHFDSLPSPRNPTPLEAELETRRSASDHWAFPVLLGAVYHFG